MILFRVLPRHTAVAEQVADLFAVHLVEALGQLVIVALAPQSDMLAEQLQRAVGDAALVIVAAGLDLRAIGRKATGYRRQRRRAEPTEQG